MKEKIKNFLKRLCNWIVVKPLNKDQWYIVADATTGNTLGLGMNNNHIAPLFNSKEQIQEFSQLMIDRGFNGVLQIRVVTEQMLADARIPYFYWNIDRAKELLCMI